MTDNQNKIVQAIRSRQTVKVIADDQEMSSFNSGALKLSQIDEIIATAGWAPFHHPSHQTHRADNKKMVEITLYTYTLYYSTKPESYLKRSTSLASSDFSSP